MKDTSSGDDDAMDISMDRNMDAEWDAAIDALDAQRARREEPSLFEVDAERRAFLVEHPWSTFKARVEARLERTDTRRRLNWTLWFSGLASACSLAVVFLVVASQSTVPSLLGGAVGDDLAGLEDNIRSKGGEGPANGVVAGEIEATLRVIVDGRAITPGESLAAETELTFQVDSGDYDHVLVFSLEASGAITPYYPESESGQSLAIGRGRGLWLPDSVVLDDSPHSELLVAVFSEGPLSWTEVKTAADRAAAELFQRRHGADGVGVDALPSLDLPGTKEARVWFDKPR